MPAVIAVTQEPLLVYAAMIFAILGLRSLYFILAALTRYLVHLEKSVIALLFFIGFKWEFNLGTTPYSIQVSIFRQTPAYFIVLGVLFYWCDCITYFS